MVGPRINPIERLKMTWNISQKFTKDNSVHYMSKKKGPKMTLNWKYSKDD